MKIIVAFDLGHTSIR